MTVFDYTVLAVVGFSVLLAIWRGAVREAFHLAGWVAAFFLAGAYAPALAGAFPQALGPGPLRLGFAFVLLFLATLIVSALMGLVLSRLVRGAGLGLADRSLGAVIGFARGLVIVIAAVMLAGLTSLPRETYWKHARLSGPLVLAVLTIKPWLPEDLARRLRYE